MENKTATDRKVEKELKIKYLVDKYNEHYNTRYHHENFLDWQSPAAPTSSGLISVILLGRGSQQTLTVVLNEKEHKEWREVASTRTVTPRPRNVAPRLNTAPRKPAIKLVDVPPSSRISFLGTAHAFKCECGGDPWFCGHILGMFKTGSDFEKWRSQTFDPMIVGVDVPLTRQLAVPMFDHVMHRVNITKMVTPDWEGNNKVKYLIDPLSAVGGGQRFFDPDEDDMAWRMIQALTYETVSNASYEEQRDTSNFIDGASSSNCTSNRHNFGTNKKLQDWIREDVSVRSPQDSYRFNAQVFCIMNYGMCYFCWRATETLFDLVTDPTSF